LINPLRFDPAAALTLRVDKDDLQRPTIQALLKNEKTFTDIVDYRGVPVLAVTRYIEGVDWGLVAKIDKDSGIFVNVDRGRIFQVISNLLSNALKFTEQGSITVAIDKKISKDNNDNNQVIVSVKVTGTGIDPEILPRLFTKFVTKSDVGTGLGLYISKSIVDAHGGKIWAENNINNNNKLDEQTRRGSTFYFTLPSS
jgi:signal transduction histidine kinase